MLKQRLILFISMLSFMCLSALADPPENLNTLKKQLMQYHDSGQYYQDIAAIVKEARDYMQFRLIQNERARYPQKLAMVIDVDETALSNYADLVKLQFGGTKKEINQLEDTAHSSAIPPIRSLYRFACQNGIAVFFITARLEYQREATVRNLAQVGYKNYKALYMKPENYHNKSAAPFKTAMRRQIEQAGYDIIVNIGDQESDLQGSYADMSFKVPNPFYFTS